VALTDELDAVAATAATHAAPGERMTAILVAEPHPGERTYICAYTGDDATTWLAFDAQLHPISSRERVRAAVSIAALCELAEENAGGGELEALRQKLETLRLTEHPPGIDDAEDAALALEAAIGTAPRVATPAYLDDVGLATRRLEIALGGGDAGSPFSVAMQQALGSVEELTAAVEANYKVPLS
jgi:hypothetical protein